MDEKYYVYYVGDMPLIGTIFSTSSLSIREMFVTRLIRANKRGFMPSSRDLGLATGRYVYCDTAYAYDLDRSLLSRFS